MIYVMSDLHGNYEKYRDMLQLIHFSEQDTLFIIGDVCDRGSESAKIYLDIMSRQNVCLIKGNHEVMAEEHLGYLLREPPAAGTDLSDFFAQKDLWSWVECGGGETLFSLYDESEEDRIRIYEFIKGLPLYQTVTVNGKHYVLVHGGIRAYHKEARITQIDPDELLWSYPNFDATYFEEENTFLVVGHTPTFLLQEDEKPATIHYGKGNVIAIDCGAAFPECLGRLGCLCLNTREAFYV